MNRKGMTAVEAILSGLIGAIIVTAAVFFFTRLSRSAENAKRANDADGRLRVLVKWIKEDYERRLVPRGTGKGLGGTNEDKGWENEMFVMPGGTFLASGIAGCPTKESDASCQGLRIRQRTIITNPVDNSSTFKIRMVEWSTQCVAESGTPVNWATAPQMHPDLTCGGAGQRSQIVRSYTADTSTADPPVVKVMPSPNEDWLHSASVCFRMVPDCNFPTIPRTIEASLSLMYHGTDRPHVVTDTFSFAAEERNPAVEKIPP